MLSCVTLAWKYLDDRHMTRNINSSSKTKFQKKSAPRYLQEVICPVESIEPRCRLRSACSADLTVPATRRSTLGDRAFAVAGPRAWNTLPDAIRRCSSPDTFKRSVKTRLYIHRVISNAIISAHLYCDICKVSLKYFFIYGTLNLTFLHFTFFTLVLSWLFRPLAPCKCSYLLTARLCCVVQILFVFAVQCCRGSMYCGYKGRQQHHL